jgi:hypothetical protein
MKKSTYGALFALLLAFAAPVPVAESPTGNDQESVFDLSRPSRSAVRIALQRPQELTRVVVEPPPPAPLPCPSPLCVRLPADGIPPTFCRPPPL